MKKRHLYIKIKFIFWILFYYSLMVNYGHHIEQKFDVIDGFNKINFNFFYYMLNIIPVLGYGLIFPAKMKYVSDYIVFFILIFVNIPIGYFCLLKTNNIMVSSLLVLLNFSWVVFWRLTRNKFIAISIEKFRWSFKNVVIITILLVSFYFLLRNGLEFNLYQKSDIYKVREQFKSKDLGLILSYLFTIMQYSIIPLTIVIATKLKSRLLKIMVLTLAVFCAFSIFSATALKSSLFVLVFVFIGYLISKIKLNSTNKILMLINIFIIFLICFRTYSPILEELYTHVLRRVFYSPVKTGVFAYEYFLNCPSCGIFGGIGDNIGHTLSKVYFKTEGNATTGFLANSLLNRGVFGTVLNIIILLFTFKVIDTITRNSPIKYGLMCFIVYGYVLSNTALFSTLASYGLALSIITFKLLNKWLKN